MYRMYFDGLFSATHKILIELVENGLVSKLFEFYKL